MNNFKRLSQNAHWLLRIAIASVFIYHGMTKFPMLGKLAAMMKMPVMMIALLASMETAGGLLVLTGGFLKPVVTRIGTVLLAPVMLGAIFMMHWGQWSFMVSKTHPMGGMEFQVTLLLVIIYLFVIGNPADESA
ncbi:MAG: hypothetical protein DRJ08_03465 [Acidobacteria bacterium]|nr:MAG: hypothetical protein DRJ14_04870 [Acidobacteriota bacterium]RLE22881.1 MAG: hypothetical protein DRJ08_03465 [Acidobacteriota bacterium]